jgi:hypothetical protein
MTRAGLAVLTVLLIAHVLVSASLAATSFHRHTHSSDPSRGMPDCAVCLFAHGKVSADIPSPVVYRIHAIAIELNLVLTPSPSASCDYRVSPSRAPPA